MATPLQTEAEQQAAARSLQAQQAVRAFRDRITVVKHDLEDALAELAIDQAAARIAVGGDPTRPHYTDDIGKLHVQERRFDALRDALLKV